MPDIGVGAGKKQSGPDGIKELRRRATLLKTGALQDAIFNNANFSIIATDEKGIIQLFNIGAERMLGLRGRRNGESDHPGPHFRSTGSDRARRGIEPRAVNHDNAGIRGAGLQG
jgi:PAS domain-containing protein